MGHKILVVDDEPALRELFAEVLRREGYEVDVVESGELALEAIKGNGYGLVFLDLRMPGWDGVKTLRMIRELDSSIPVYISTGFYPDYLISLKEVSLEGLDFEVIEKPIGRGQLASVAKGVLLNGA